MNLRASSTALLLALGACTHTYQPLQGLHTPVVVDPTAPNLVGVDLTVRCVPGSGTLARGDARSLCRKVGILFESQGATVHVADSRGTVDPLDDEAPTETTTDLVLELRARDVPPENHSVSYALAYATLTLLPAVEEYPFALDVTVRDGSGFLLAEERLAGRVVARYGVGPWVASHLVDRGLRREKDWATEAAASEALSKDLYGQLSQLVYNAKVQWALLSDPRAINGGGR